MLGNRTCVTHWRELVPPSAMDLALLTRAETQRMASIQSTDDAYRFAIGTILAKQVIGAHLAVEPRDVVVDRHCHGCGREHGRPNVPYRDIWISISHAGRLVGVSISQAGPVGIDVEPVETRDLREIASYILGPEEAGDASSEELLRYWVRKEALVKATGDGITIGLDKVIVSPPRCPAALISYQNRPGLAAQMTDLSALPSHLAAVTVLAMNEVKFIESWSLST